MLGDAWDLNQLLRWSGFFLDPDFEYDDEFCEELASLQLDLVNSFDACLKAHVKAFCLGTSKGKLPVS